MEIEPKIKEEAIAYSVVMIDEKAIDEFNILEATKIAMKKAIKEIEDKLKNQNKKLDLVLVDGNDIDIYRGNKQNVIKGDSKSLSIAAASILAKVHRDKYMEKMAELYPEYDFENNKGYGTKKHRDALAKVGKCKIHRETFIKNII